MQGVQPNWAGSEHSFKSGDHIAGYPNDVAALPNLQFEFPKAADVIQENNEWASQPIQPQQRSQFEGSEQFFSNAEKYACDPTFLQERRRLQKRIHELETVVDMMRLNETHGVRNRDMTINVYQNKVQELTMRLSEKHYLEEHYREVQDALKEKEEVYTRLEQQYKMLQEESTEQQRSLSEQLGHYEQACKDLEQHISLQERRHQQIVERFQAQAQALLEEKDNIQKRMVEAEDHRKIVEAELIMQRRMRLGGQDSPRHADTPEKSPEQESAMMPDSSLPRIYGIGSEAAGSPYILPAFPHLGATVGFMTNPGATAASTATLDSPRYPRPIVRMQSAPGLPVVISGGNPQAQPGVMRIPTPGITTPRMSTPRGGQPAMPVHVRTASVPSSQAGGSVAGGSITVPAVQPLGSVQVPPLNALLGARAGPPQLGTTLGGALMPGLAGPQQVMGQPPMYTGAPLSHRSPVQR